MPLSAGRSLSFYEILGPLGVGGMGEVYRAKDTRLEREVAIKVLPEEFAEDDERLRRFEREAKTLASLNHPNIAGIHGVDQEEDVYFLALELVPGEDLATRLRRGPLPLAEAIDVGRQIAEGLEAAHEAGVVHRDLKPANVRVTPDGVVKLLDFGLAKPIRPKAGKEGTTTAESDSFLVTEEGLVLGTPTYMSPEQARGKPVDRRTDIWAFGCVLFEMLTGQRAFQGESYGELVAAILEHEVPLDALPSGTPPRVCELIARCLVKDPRQRLRDAGEARLALESPYAETAGTGRSPSAASPLARTSPWACALIALVLGVAAGRWWGGEDRAEAPGRTWTKFTQLTDQVGAETDPSLSMDGTLLVYASREAGSSDIYVQRVGGRTALAVAADPERNEAAPAFSPDGTRIAYHESGADGGIWITGATGENTRRLTDFGFDPAWSPDGARIAFVSAETDDPYSRDTMRSSLWVVPAAGGRPELLNDGDSMQPAWSPSGARIAFWRSAGGQRDLATAPAEGGEPVPLLDDEPLDWSPVWAPDGRHLYFASDRGGSMGLWRLPIDEASGQALGEPEAVAGGLETSVSQPCFSADGSRLVFRSEVKRITPVAIPFDHETETAGEPWVLFPDRGGVLRPSDVSPDGEWLAMSNRGARQEDLFLSRVDGSELRRLTDDFARDREPMFMSSDPHRLSFMSNRSGDYGTWAVNTDGSGLEQVTGESSLRLLDLDHVEITFRPSSDDTFSVALPPWPLNDLGRFELSIELHSGIFGSYVVSPDGRRVHGAAIDQDGERVGVAVFDLETGDGRVLSVDRGTGEAKWLSDSRRLVHLSEEGVLQVIDADTGERRVVPVDLPAPPSDTTVALAHDDSAIYYGALRIESNIWMVELGH